MLIDEGTRQAPQPSWRAAGWGNCVGWRNMGPSAIGSSSRTESCTVLRTSTAGAVANPTLLAALLVDLAIRLSCMGSEDRYVADTGRRSISCFLSSSLVAARHDSEARRATGGRGKPTPHRIPGPRHGALCPLTGRQTFRQALRQVPYAS